MEESQISQTPPNTNQEGLLFSYLTEDGVEYSQQEASKALINKNGPLIPEQSLDYLRSSERASPSDMPLDNEVNSRPNNPKAKRNFSSYCSSEIDPSSDYDDSDLNAYSSSLAKKRKTTDVSQLIKSARSSQTDNDLKYGPVLKFKVNGVINTDKLLDRPYVPAIEFMKKLEVFLFAGNESKFVLITAPSQSGKSTMIKHFQWLTMKERLCTIIKEHS
ncbi:DNA mismatch repair protein MutS [Acrasis kona]|uniref:DNA mismatch repair protein MutS n=1 Tax=Acrasis kona TaxID=1008807 RepID=A0AAW2YPD8_9EUKA